MKKHLLIIIIIILGSVQVYSQTFDSTEYAFGGYIKADFLNTWYLNGDVGATSPLRDFHLPSQIPIGPSDRNFNLDYHVKESRFNFDVTTKMLGKKAHGFLELDFLLSSQGDEKVSNSFNPRLRHFFMEWNNFLIGQTWTTFMIVIIPDDLDFAGALDGLVFGRQPQVRFTAGNWQFAVENPETTVIGYQQSDISVTEKEVLPDLVVRRNFKGDWGTIGIAGIYRSLNGKDTSGVVRRAPAFGITAGGKLLVGQNGDDFRFQGTYGNGLGRYLAANFIAGGVLDQNNDINTIGSVNGYVAYNHFWIKEKLSSSFNVSGFKAISDENLVGPEANDMSLTAAANIKYKPHPKLMFGMEGRTGYREVLDGTNGQFYRVQFAAKYWFGYKDLSIYEKN